MNTGDGDRKDDNLASLKEDDGDMEDIELRPQDGEGLGRTGGRAGPAIGCFPSPLSLVYFLLSSLFIFYFFIFLGGMGGK